jgi:hypothetical protein
MGIQTDVKSVTVTADGTAYGGRARVKSLVLTNSASAGSVVLKDGGASGVARITINTPAGADLHNIVIPDQGVVFESDVYVDVTNVTSVTIFHG